MIGGIVCVYMCAIVTRGSENMGVYTALADACPHGATEVECVSVRTRLKYCVRIEMKALTACVSK